MSLAADNTEREDTLKIYIYFLKFNYFKQFMKLVID